MSNLSWIRLQWLVPFCLALATEAQGKVWTIDDSAGTGADFASIQAAIDDSAVVDGDVLLVAPRSYASLSLANGKALTIQADVGGVASVPTFPLCEVFDLPAGKSVGLRGLSMRQLTLSNCAGTVWVEECIVTGYAEADGISVTSCDDVILIKNSVRAGDGGICVDVWVGGTRSGIGLSVSDGSAVHSYGCRFQGGDGGSERGFSISDPCFGSWGGAGVASTSAQNELFFSDCELEGGRSNYCVADSSWCFCPRGGTGLVSLGQVFVLDSTLTGGLGRPIGWSCAAAPDGFDYTGTPQFLPGRAMRVTTGSPVRENSTVSLQIEGPPHVPVWMAYAAAPKSSALVGFLRGISLVPLLSPATGFDWLGVTDASGSLDLTLPFGALPAGRESSLAFVQVFYMESPILPGGFKVLRVPPVPKVFVLGQASMLIGLDESF